MNLTKSMREITAIVAVTFFLGACEKEAATTAPQASSSSLSQNDEQLVSEQALIEAGTVEELNAIFSSDALGSNGGCPPVTTYDPSPDVYPHVVTIDWGTGCTNSDGITRTGRMTFKYTAPLTELGGAVVTRYQKYSINGISRDGEWRLENIGVGSNGKNLFKLMYTNFKTTQANGDFVIMQGTRKVQLLGGSPTPDLSNGSYRITGTLKFTRQIGSVLQQFDNVITKPLAHPAGCKWFSSGVYQNVFPNQSTVTFDYGRGGCDNQATLTQINGTVRTITLQ